MEPVYATVIGACLTMFKTMGWQVRYEGVEHLPATGPAVVATNHVGYMDFIFIGAAVREQNKRRLRFLAKKEVFDHNVSGPLMRAMKHIPVDRAGRAADSLTLAVDSLKRGEMIGMFPESTIVRSFVPREGKSGAARMALEAGVPLIPGAVWGSQRILTKDRPRNMQRGVAINVVFGPPIDPGSGDPAEVAERLMTAIRELTDRLQRDYPQQPAGDDDRWWLPAHLGGTAPTVEESEAMARADADERRARRARERRASSD